MLMLKLFDFAEVFTAAHTTGACFLCCFDSFKGDVPPMYESVY
jgi:hypothetical protein